MDRQIIQPRTLKGFADVLPGAGQYRRRLLRVIEDTFCSFGFDPIQTPNVEYAEILKGKGGGDNDKQMFEFQDAGGRDVALRFDLTVPLARFVAQYESKLTMPLRAYNIGYVFRGDRPQKGRYREFLQCDADIIGDTDLAADAEILTIAQTALSRLNFGGFVVRVNHRRLVNGLLSGLDLGDRGTPVLRALDKIDKIGPAGVTAELGEAGVDAAVVQRILAVLAARGETNEATFAAVGDLVDSAEAEAGLDEMRQILDLVGAAGGDRELVRFDPSIVRGLDYYTGMVYEIAFTEAPEVGSIGGGGRYDNLTGLYTRSRFPGVGGTIGVTRLMSALEGLGRIKVGSGR
jgi:histidyl-tRNA synthetase